jgi:hypothetical protein
MMRFRTAREPASTNVVPIAYRRAFILLFAASLSSSCTEAPPPQARADEHWPMLEKYCVDCHNATDLTADIAFDEMSPAAIANEAEVWERVVRQLRSRTMPPPGGPRPASDEVDGFVAWMEASIDQEAAPNPGNIELHRLNRTEYANAIKELLALDVDRGILPVDDVADGFDNIARALQVSPAFIEQYLEAARTVSAQAIGNPFPRAIGVPYTVGDPRAQQQYVEGLPLGTRGGGLIEHYFPSDGEYKLNIGDLATGFSYTNYEHAHTLIATLDGKKFFELEVGGGEDARAVDQIGAPAVTEVNSRLKNIPFTTTAGMHKLGVTFLQRSFAESDKVLHSLIAGGGQDSVLTVSTVEIFGPVTPSGLSSTASRDKIFVCYPNDEREYKPCATEIVTHMASKAFRGQSADEDIAKFMRLYEIGAAGGFEQGIKYALSGVFAHPKFLYRFEPAPDDIAPTTAYALSSVELASRLSFFLWSTIPDQELLDVAAADGLKDSDIFERQVRRMLADSRSETLASNFAHQWLGLGKLDALTPDPFIFGDVDRNIRDYFVEEARLFVDSIFREDRSVVELLTAKHTYLNEPLALHYGLNDIRGVRFRRVELSDPNRWGLIGKGGVLLASSYPNRTSPVLRGAWVLERIIGTAPPEPPPGVEGLVENVEGEVATTVRERLEAHRKLSSCNACHGILDPLGFALENFDAVGRWREKDREAGTLIDASGVLADGTAVEGPVELRDVILKRPDQFVQTLVERLMTYGLGRSLDYRDMPAVRRVVRAAAAEDYRFSALVLGIVNSPQFQMKSSPAADNRTLSASAAGD